ncbi:MAG: AAA family ATPase [Acidimicrobiales bacterium]
MTTPEADRHEPNRPDMTPERYRELAEAIAAGIGTVIVGQHGLVEEVLRCLLAEGHILLEGVPGLGKTQLLKTLAQTLDMPWSRIQFTPDLMPADIVGTQVLHQGDDGARDLRFRPGPITAHLVLADEVNRATPKTQAAMLEAMAERSVTVGGDTRPLPRPFMVMATQNPLEMEGTYPLPEAQLDRFLVKAVVPFPSADELVTIIERTTGSATAEPEPVCDAATLRRMIDLTKAVPVPDHVTRHAVDLVVATHPGAPTAPEPIRRYVRFGASPRGVQAMILTAKARALMDGRPSVAVDDVRAGAVGALRHRLVVGYEAAADGRTTDDLVADVLAAVPAPASGVRGAP